MAAIKKVNSFIYMGTSFDWLR